MQILIPETEADFARYFDLRWRLLRASWNQPRGSERDTLEDQSWHRMACDEDRIPIGVARLHRNSPEQVQIRYMAVEPAWRRQGVGTALVHALEARALELNVLEIVLDAREESVEFYRRLGYEVIGSAHTLFDCIRHSSMRKRLR
ncbi:MAG TPA: GNAT family N-acetyltransferase [Gammaproteobacteria bacterium]